MDIVKGAKLLAELFERRDRACVEKPKVETGLPLFRWVGVHPPAVDSKETR